MVIDCDRCTARGDACGDCVVGVLLGGPPRSGWAPAERLALEALAAGGLVPRLRMVPGTPAAGPAGRAGARSR